MTDIVWGDIMTDETDLWHKVTRTVTPIKRDAPEHMPAPARKPVTKKEIIQTPAEPKHTPTQTPGAATAKGIDGHLQRKLSRGNVRIDATLDLHGHSRHQAYDVTHRFIINSVSKKHHVVLVITGKGHENKGTLRIHTPDVIRNAPGVLHVAQAHRKHGGDGAFYVVLKR